jgi:hypothetical protein
MGRPYKGTTSVERFWSRVNKHGPVPAHRPELGPCWEWIGGCDVFGYGQITVAGKNEKAHRLAYKLTHGFIPEGKWVLHRCDNPRCVNEAHLFLGTHSDNMADMVAKGRASNGGRGPRGETHPLARLTESQVRGIRSRCAAGESMRAVASSLGLGKTTVQHIVHQRTWAQVA